MTRRSVLANARCIASSWVRNAATTVVVTSMPERRKPAAIAGSTCSSRWKRIRSGMTCGAFLVQHGRHRLSERLFQLRALRDFLVYFGLMHVVILPRGVNVLQGYMGHAHDQVRRRCPGTQRLDDMFDADTGISNAC